MVKKVLMEDLMLMMVTKDLTLVELMLMELTTMRAVKRELMVKIVVLMLAAKVLLVLWEFIELMKAVHGEILFQFKFLALIWVYLL